ncbi:hypothetical protein RND81_09G068700 [Saponaria officinalis]|uniref:Uncharacterized protein n=1 Tax=Saponaria officinalis TaxID=3572 RepID=A0AAW1IJN1_SAPOF
MEWIYVVPIWILFSGLDPYLWSESILSKLARKVGNPLFADKTTTLKGRLSFARVMVEVDVSGTLPTKVVFLNPFTSVQTQEITYEWVLYFCSCCKKIGHTTPNCKRNKVKAARPSQIPSPGQPPIVDEDVNSECLGLGSSFSPLDHEGPLREAVTHIVCSKLGCSSTHQEISCPVVEGVASCQPCVGLLGGVHQEVVTANSFSVLGDSVFCPLEQLNCNSIMEAEALDVFGLLETRVRRAKAAVVMSKVSSSYNVLSNYDFHSNGRIWVVWNSTHVTFVYASNTPAVRLFLWESLRQISNAIQSWVFWGDFNVVRDIFERISDHPPNLSEILDFNACILNCGLDDMQSTGCEYSWTNNQDGSRVWSKLDRVLINNAWLRQFPSSSTKVMLAGISDHSPLLVTLFEDVKPRKPIQKRVKSAKQDLESCQRSLQSAPLYTFLLQEEERLLGTYIKFRKVELSIMKQKAKAQEIANCDGGTGYFYSKLRERTLAQIIGKIVDHTSMVRVGLEDVAAGFTAYYESLPGTPSPVSHLNGSIISQGKLVHESDWSHLTLHVTDIEIQRALKSIEPNRSPGPDGFSSLFFIQSWEVIGADFCHCIRDYFKRGYMAKQANSTLITLIPKKENASNCS